MAIAAEGAAEHRRAADNAPEAANGQERVNFGKVEPRNDERGWSGSFLGTVVG